uniref:Uncharacterized protein n=1 Tax=Rhizophora mucronata TaxID=61149 RepID=A0A2P2PEM5_RHIMU
MRAKDRLEDEKEEQEIVSNPSPEASRGEQKRHAKSRRGYGDRVPEKAFPVGDMQSWQIKRRTWRATRKLAL